MNKKFFILFSNAMLVTAIATAQQGPPKPPGNEEKLKHVSEKINKEITLTAAQKTKVEAAYKDFFIEMEKLRKNNKDGKPEMPPPPPPPPGKKEDVDKLAKARDAKIKAALSEVQYKKYSEIEQTLRPPRPGGPPPH
jgi:Spy/CpxP family protein refolding chaperone